MDVPDFPLLVLIKNDKANPALDDLFFVSKKKIMDTFL